MKTLSRCTVLTCLAVGVFGMVPAYGQSVEEMTRGVDGALRRLSRDVIFEDGQNKQAYVLPPAAAPLPTMQSRPVQSASAAVPSERAFDILVYFPFGSTTPKRESYVAIQNMAALLARPQYRDHRFIIVGHTDAKGDWSYNLKLSRDRAGAVMQALIALGASPAQLDVQGLGPMQLIDPGHPFASVNRRVEVRVS